MVDGEHRGRQDALGDNGFRRGQGDHRGRVDGWAEALDGDAGGQVRGGGGEDVAAVEGGGDRGQAVLGGGQLVDGRATTEGLGGGDQQAIVRADEHGLAGGDGDGAAGGADA